MAFFRFLQIPVVWNSWQEAMRDLAALPWITPCQVCLINQKLGIGMLETKLIYPEQAPKQQWDVSNWVGCKTNFCGKASIARCSWCCFQLPVMQTWWITAAIGDVVWITGPGTFRLELIYSHIYRWHVTMRPQQMVSECSSSYSSPVGGGSLMDGWLLFILSAWDQPCNVID